MRSSGKGSGPRHGPKTRHQKVLAFPAWGGKTGCDVYFSSRWDNECQIYDHFHTGKSIVTWWQTEPWEWVFVQELPFDLSTEDFVWTNAKSLPSSELRKKRHWQKQKHLANARRENRR